MEITSAGTFKSPVPRQGATCTRLNACVPRVPHSQGQVAFDLGAAGIAVCE